MYLCHCQYRYLNTVGSKSAYRHSNDDCSKNVAGGPGCGLDNRQGLLMGFNPGKLKTVIVMC